MVILALGATASAKWKESVLYSFQGGTDGATPAGGVVFDKAGNLYGANSWGGFGGCPSPGCGTVFQISPPKQKGGAWTETTIYAFRGVLGSVKDGLTPEGGLTIDQNGNLYGTTSIGGNGPCVLLGSPVGCGIVYELSPPTQKGGQWTYTILYNFQGGNDGYFPEGDLTFDKQGNLYGATWYGGGRGNSCNPNYGGNCGTVFKLTAPRKLGGTWTEEILHNFSGLATGKQMGDGGDPSGGLALNDKGAIFGTAFIGGYNCPHGNGQGCGAVFRLSPPTRQGGAWVASIIHRFVPGGSDGAYPSGGATLDSKGRLYGTTQLGGSAGHGTVFKFSPPAGQTGEWKEKLLYSFTGKNDGGPPMAGVIARKSGNLYGTALGGASGSGTVFRLAPVGGQRTWNFALLYTLRGTPDGHYSAAGVIFDAYGNIYSTTQGGGNSDAGTVFEIRR
jgi:uncharacterized repeat protein (TIGR03803 family)